MNLQASLKFLSFVREGLAQSVAPGGSVDLKFTILQGKRKVDSQEYLFTESNHSFGGLYLKDASFVTSFDAACITRTFPEAKAQNHNPLNLVYAEFKDPDFLWRYSPQVTFGPNNTKNPKLVSWLYLLVLEASEFDWITSKGSSLPQINVKPDNPQQPNIYRPKAIHAPLAHLWASVQELDATVSSGTAKVQVGRLFSPRKLDNGKSYHAFIVPHFEGGRLRGLQRPIENSDKLWYSLPTGTLEYELPVYHHWMFSTKEAESFMISAKKIKVYEGGDSLNGFETSISNIGYGLERELSTNETMLLEGLYGSPKYDDDNTLFVSSQYSNLELMDGIRQLVNTGIVSAALSDPYDLDPTVVPPAYGHLQSSLFASLNPKTELTIEDDTWDPWYYEVNLDPRYRAIAGLGAQVVRDNQTYFVDQALSQLNNVSKVNTNISNVQSNYGVNSIVQPRITNSTSNEYSLKFYASVKDRVLIQDGTESRSLENLVGSSVLGPSFLTAKFRNITAPRSNLYRKFTGVVQHEEEIGAKIIELGLTDRQEIDYSVHIDNALDAKVLNNLLKTITKFVVLEEGEEPAGQLLLSDFVFLSPGYSTAPSNASTYFKYAEFKDWVLSYVKDTLNPNVDSIELIPWQAIDLNQVSDSIAQSHSADAIAARSLNRIGVVHTASGSGTSVTTSVGINQIEVTPTYNIPMVKYLAKDHPELLSAKIETIPDNTISLVAANDKFVEAFMLGLNQELASEFRWRNLPVNKFGTYFKLFWDKSENVGVNRLSPDIADINKWFKDVAQPPPSTTLERVGPKLGQNVLDSTQTNSITLLIRAELLRKYPDAIVYLQRAIEVDIPQPISTDPSVGVSELPDAVGIATAPPRTFIPIQSGSSTSSILASDVKFPLKQVRSKGDVIAFTFGLKLEDATANAGWFLVLEERLTQLTFGFEAGSWPMDSLFDPSIPPTTTPPLISSSSNSADFAARAVRQPSRVYIHLSNYFPNA